MRSTRFHFPIFIIELSDSLTDRVVH
jgi:hypothetical protein